MKLAVCGHFGFGKNLLNGQTVKTKILSSGLKSLLGDCNVWEIDTHGMRNTLLMFPRLIWALVICDNVIILPAHRGLKMISVWLRFWNIFFCRNLHYIVIGGWLTKYLDNHRLTAFALKGFKGIYVETSTMRDSLQRKGYSNILVLPNCKELSIIDEGSLKYQNTKPYRLVTFSRVSRLKGIGELISIIRKINFDCACELFKLDIYGPVSNVEKDWFDSLEINSDSAIRYMGCVAFDKSVEVLKNYFTLIFPTKSYTEGIPGTIIDAYAAGLPVVSARWESFSDVIDEGVTGLGFEFENWGELEKILLKIANEPSIINNLRKNCLKKAKRYHPKFVVEDIVNNII